MEKIGVGAAWNIANVKEGKSTAVFGLGSVGLAVRLNFISSSRHPKY